MFRTTIVAIIVSLLAVVGMPAQAGKTGTGDAQLQGTNIVAGTPADVARGLSSGADMSLANPYVDNVSGQSQAGGNSNGMMTDVFGGTAASSAVPVPEPGTIILGGLGMLMLWISRRIGRFGKN